MSKALLDEPKPVPKEAVNGYQNATPLIDDFIRDEVAASAHPNLDPSVGFEEQYGLQDPAVIDYDRSAVASPKLDQVHKCSYWLAIAVLSIMAILLVSLVSYIMCFIMPQSTTEVLTTVIEQMNIKGSGDFQNALESFEDECWVSG